MEESTSSSAQINSVIRAKIAYLNKKRKLQDEMLEMPCPKHIRTLGSLECDSSFNSNAEPKMENDKFVSGGESDLDSAKDSNSFDCNTGSIMSNDDESKTDSAYPESTQISTSYEISPYPSDTRSLSKSSSCEAETLLNYQQPDGPHHKDELHFEGEFGGCPDCFCSDYFHDGTDEFTDKELESLLYSNSVDPSNFVLSSGRWTVHRDGQQGGKKPTIDKEFEEYFSMLML